MKRRNKIFLSDDLSEGGSISWQVRSEGTAYNQYIESELHITDCSKRVILEFDCYKDKDIPKRIDKITRFIDELVSMKEALQDVQKELLEKKKFTY